jgi:hypothetical protein
MFSLTHSTLYLCQHHVVKKVNERRKVWYYVRQSLVQEAYILIRQTLCIGEAEDVYTITIKKYISMTNDS